MANTQVGTLHRRSIVKDMRGNIITLLDEADGGYIIKNRQVVNEAKWKEYLRVQQDKQEAIKAASEPKIRTDYPETQSGETKSGETNVSKVDELEKKVNDMDSKIEAILKAVSK